MYRTGRSWKREPFLGGDASIEAPSAGNNLLRRRLVGRNMVASVVVSKVRGARPNRVEGLAPSYVQI